MTNNIYLQRLWSWRPSPPTLAFLFVGVTTMLLVPPIGVDDPDITNKLMMIMFGFLFVALSLRWWGEDVARR